MSVQRDGFPDHADVPWDPYMDNCTGQPAWGFSDFCSDHFTAKHAESDSTHFPTFDLSSYFEFHGSNPDTGLPKMTEDWATLMDSMLEDLPTTCDVALEHKDAS